MLKRLIKIIFLRVFKYSTYAVSSGEPEKFLSEGINTEKI